MVPFAEWMQSANGWLASETGVMVNVRFSVPVYSPLPVMSTVAVPWFRLFCAVTV